MAGGLVGKVRVHDLTIKPIRRNYLVIAATFEHLRAWARLFSISHRQLHLVRDFSDMAGYKDYDVIILTGSDMPEDARKYLFDFATNIYDIKSHYPITKEGIIVDWKAFNGDG